MSNLNEEILNQIRLMGYDRSKILSEQKTFARSFSDFFEKIGKGVEDFFGYDDQDLEEWGKDKFEFLKDLDPSDPDTVVGSISALLGVIPGLGSLGSAFIDVVHGTTYLVRAPFQSDTIKQLEYYLLGIFTICMAFDPSGSGGNVLVLTLKGKLKEVLNMTPCRVLNMIGFTCINFDEKRYSFKKVLLLWLIKTFFGGLYSEVISYLARALGILNEGVDNICTFLNRNLDDKLNSVCDFFNELINGLQSDVKDNKIKNLVELEEELQTNTELYKKKCIGIKNWNGKNTIRTNPREMQVLMNYLGHSIKVDNKFGNETANAIGTFIYGSKMRIDTVYKLWEKMKSDGWDVGKKFGFGPKMATSLSILLTRIVSKIDVDYDCEFLNSI